MAEIERLDVVAIAPHPDDLEILCGGTLAKLVRQGYKVGMFDLTSGEPTPRGTPETRRIEAEEARRILGVPLRLNIELPNRVLMDSPENRFKLATAFRRYRPGIILVAAGRTPGASPDHYQGQLIGEAARFYSQFTKWDDRFQGTAPYRVPHLVYVPYPSDADQKIWHSTMVVDVTETMDQKLAAVKSYHSQFDDERFERVKHYIVSTNGYHGYRCGFKYGELFALPHPVGTSDLVAAVHGSKPTPPPIAQPTPQPAEHQEK
ncbi:MAG TPA: PIG-L family deacetylase [Gemmata sp.]|nr:PIG-L family deacetylase [Gemmata sp.]